MYRKTERSIRVSKIFSAENIATGFESDWSKKIILKMSQLRGCSTNKQTLKTNLLTLPCNGTHSRSRPGQTATPSYSVAAI